MEFPEFKENTSVHERNSHLCTWKFGKETLSADGLKNMFTGCCPYPWSEH